MTTETEPVGGASPAASGAVADEPTAATADGAAAALGRVEHPALVDAPARYVLARYDELAALLSQMDDRPPADPSLSAEAAAVLAHEARLLDAGRFEDWLRGWTDDAILWVPLSAPAHPGSDQSLLLDDRRRLGERIEWRLDPSAWGQQPPSRTTRVLGSVEAWNSPGGRLVVRSTILIDEQRHGQAERLSGCQIHELVGEPGARRYRTKILVLGALSRGVRNPSFLL